MTLCDCANVQSVYMKVYCIWFSWFSQTPGSQKQLHKQWPLLSPCGHGPPVCSTPLCVPLVLHKHKFSPFLFLTVAETRFLSALLTSSSSTKGLFYPPTGSESMKRVHFLNIFFSFSSRKPPSADQALCIVGPSILVVAFGQMISFRVSFR